MGTDNLDDLDSKELHDRAFSRALHHADLKFFLELLEVAPAARAGEGDLGESYNDVLRPSSLLTEAIDRDPKLLDAMRPVYLEYLRAHADA